ncbi:uncharacterized protein TNCV_2436351 [Trichonephila clavipes]|nr:uncharacterized protein TNCV_2436351 [Trichonephila clavipes]
MSRKISAILELFQRGKRLCEIVRLLNVPRQTVSDAICRFKELGNDNRRPGSGRKRTVNTSRNQKSATETEILQHMYRSDTLLRTQAFECHPCFREGRESVEDNERSGCPHFPQCQKHRKGFYDGTIFQELACHFQGRRFQSADTSQAGLKDTAKNGFQKCFDDPNKQ